MAGAKPHRRSAHAGSSAWTMSIDLVNLATALVPVFDSPPGDGPPAGEKPVDGEKPHDAPRPMETVDACWGEGLDEKEYSLQGDEANEKDPVGDDVENVKTMMGVTEKKLNMNLQLW